MATTIKTIEIATLIHTALRAVVPGGCAVYAHGVKTDSAGVPKENAVDIERKFPLVDIIPYERVPQQHASVLKSYPVTIRVITHAPKDRWKVEFYTIAQTVSDWLTDAPALALTLAEFDALVINGAPDMGNAGDKGVEQYMEWNITIKTRKATA